jgi:hypothetical protein
MAPSFSVEFQRAENNAVALSPHTNTASVIASEGSHCRGDCAWRPLWLPIQERLFNAFPASPTHHRLRDLFRITDYLRVRSYNLVAALAGTASGVSRLVWTNAASTVLGLTFLHDLLPDPRI